MRNISIYPRISNLTSKSIPFGISTLKGHSHSLAPYAPAFLVGETGRWRRVPRNVGQALLYSPPSGHPRDPPLGHPPRPTFHRAPMRPPLGTHPPPTGARPLSVGHLPGCPSTLLSHRVPSLRWAIPSGHSIRHRIYFIHFTTYGSFHPFSRKFIH
jgi:hypothetical protein